MGKITVVNVTEDHQVRIEHDGKMIAFVDYTRCEVMPQRYDLYIGETMIACIDKNPQ